ncbi:MAG TPA: hypothetical protein VJ739_11845 [Gemmataceae bacterium]|nr:hypothetical protein [Gemmataceae bacterium]
MLAAAGPDDRVSLLIRYKPGIKPTEAEAAYNGIDGLEAHREYPPLVTVRGNKACVEKALAHELTEGAVADFREYDRAFIGPRRR